VGLLCSVQSIAPLYIETLNSGEEDSVKSSSLFKFLRFLSRVVKNRHLLTKVAI